MIKTLQSITLGNVGWQTDREVSLLFLLTAARAPGCPGGLAALASDPHTLPLPQGHPPSPCSAPLQLQQMMLGMSQGRAGPRLGPGTEFG